MFNNACLHLINVASINITEQIRVSMDRESRENCLHHSLQG